jgi:hypothetical protein
MASLSQIEANRRNALKSAGPKTKAGKRRSCRNAVRHGLTAETVIEVLEDPQDYRAFELSVTAGFDAQTPLSANWCCDWQACCGVAPCHCHRDWFAANPKRNPA